MATVNDLHLSIVCPSGPCLEPYVRRGLVGTAAHASGGVGDAARVGRGR